MNPARLPRIRSRIEALRRQGGVKGRELESVAKAVGRRRHPRGKEPTWVSDELPSRPPLSIPGHPRDLNRITARTILDQLEEDVDELEIKYGG
jgi:hypothetical protein